jgi:hypothetical protein
MVKITDQLPDQEKWAAIDAPPLPRPLLETDSLRKHKQRYEPIGHTAITAAQQGEES